MAHVIYVGAAAQALLDLPESGPGFQFVSADYQGTRQPFLILNAERAIALSELGDFSNGNIDVMVGLWIAKAFTDPYPLITSWGLESIELATARISSQLPTLESMLPKNLPLHPSTLVKKTNLQRPRKFHRYSPFNPDKRINPSSGDFLPGTYGCPDSEVPFVPTGFAAVGRFALPGGLSASNHYEIEAVAGTDVWFGTVAPAYGQAGGGVEAYFPNGATNSQFAASGPIVIPDE
ncbi:MAG: hypothetical protein ACPGYT_15815 [Nitrospirales bacterium]